EPSAIRPMRPMTPAQASMASPNIVLPLEAWPTMAKFRISSGANFCIGRDYCHSPPVCQVLSPPKNEKKRFVLWVLATCSGRINDWKSPAPWAKLNRIGKFHVWPNFRFTTDELRPARGLHSGGVAGGAGHHRHSGRFAFARLGRQQ